MTREPNPTERDLGDEELRRVAARLGARAAEALDEGAVARVVVERLREPEVMPLRRRVRRMPVWLRIAAALAVLAGVGVVARQLTAPSEVPTRFVTADLVGLDAAALNELLQTLEETLQGAEQTGDGSLDQLDADQLETVLRSLEG